MDRDSSHSASSVDESTSALKVPVGKVDNTSVDTVVTNIFLSEDGVSVDEGVEMMTTGESSPNQRFTGSSGSVGSDYPTPSVYSDGRTATSDRPTAGVGDGVCTPANTSHSASRDERNELLFRGIEGVVLSVALVLIIVLFSIPTILFELAGNTDRVMWLAHSHLDTCIEG
jgi:hypothetical protein